MSEPILARAVRFATVGIAFVAGIAIGASALTLWPAANADEWATHAGIAGVVGLLALVCFGTAVYALRSRASVTLSSNLERP